MPAMDGHRQCRQPGTIMEIRQPAGEDDVDASACNRLLGRGPDRARRHDGDSPADVGLAGAGTADHGRPVAGRDDDDRRALPAPAAAAVQRPNRPERGPIHAGMARARGAAQGRTQYPADHDRRCRLLGAVDLRGGHPDADARRHRQGRAALHELSLDLAVLADPCCAHHRPQPPLGRLRRRLRGGDGLPRL